MIKAIETKHNGYWFRSRLEARWAVFFDNFGVSYFYEREGYESNIPPNRFRYLPDFYIPAWNAFIEIKGSVDEATDSNLSKWIYLSRELGRNFIILFVDVWPFHITAFIPSSDDYCFSLETSAFFVGPAQFCTDDSGLKYLMIFTGGYMPPLVTAINEIMDEALKTHGAQGALELLSKSDDEIESILPPMEWREIARLHVLPLDNEPHFPRVITRDIDAGYIVENDKVTGFSYDIKPGKRVDLGRSGNFILKSINGINAMNLKFHSSTRAYTAARQARFEHGENGGPR